MDGAAVAVGVGSIPACAGEPATRTEPPNLRSVYPRVCGGTPYGQRILLTHNGLSPRVRGNPARTRGYLIAFGSIPACAGEPAAGIFRWVGDEVYPRVCGGTRSGLAARRSACGLSPRVRGNPQGVEGTHTPHGSIPACAGEPQPCPFLQVLCEVYPRVCGGTRPSCATEHSAQGLSPRVRGNLDRNLLHIERHRSIPACAGEPHYGHIPVLCVRVYPRVCGGTQYPCRLAFVVRGLSPRVRGNPSDMTPYLPG